MRVFAALFLLAVLVLGAFPAPSGAVVISDNVQVLQGGAAVSSTNPLYTAVTDGTRVATVKDASTAAVTTDKSLVVAISPNGGDPCQNPGIAKSSAVINVGAATTAEIVAASSSKVVYVCGFTASLAGTSPTVVFKTGTQATNPCDTSTASRTGTFAPSTGSVIALSGTGTLFQGITSGQICATTAGSGSSFQGVLTYVQQ